MILNGLNVVSVREVDDGENLVEGVVECWVRGKAPGKRANQRKEVSCYEVKGAL